MVWPLRLRWPAACSMRTRAFRALFGRWTQATQAPRHDRDHLAATVVRAQDGVFGRDVAWHAGTPFRQEDKALLPPMSFCGRGPILAWDVGFGWFAGALRTLALTRWQ